jgi:hypothetical protein
MRRIAPVFLLFFARVLVACDAPHGVPVSDIHYVPDCGFNNAALAVSDDGAFAAWHFTHFGFGTVFGTNYGAPLDAQGRTRVNQELPFGGTSSPAIASDGHDFLYVLSFTGQTSATVVHADGTIAPSHAVAAPHTDGGASVVWTGSDYLVVTFDLIAAHVSRAGVATNVNTLTTGATLAALANGLVIWKRGTTFEAAPIGGSPVSLPAISLTSRVSVAGNGSEFLATFVDESGRVAALRLDRNGNPIGNAIEIASEAASQIVIAPQVAFDGDSYLVLWYSAGLVRAARVSSTGAVSPSFIAASGVIWSAVPADDGTMIAYSIGCGSIATRVISRGASNGTLESVVSLRPDAQTTPRIAATPFGHQLIWYESNVLHTRFVTTSGPAGATTRLSFSNYSSHATVVPFLGGTAVVWDDGGTLNVARFSADGRLVVESAPIPSTEFIFSIAVAAAGDELLIVAQGENDLFKTEVHAVRVDANGERLQEALLSSPGEDGFTPIAGADASRWYAAWRNGATQLVVIEMPRGDLRQPARFSATLPTSTSGTLGAFVTGDDPQVVWANGDVHSIHYHSGLDLLLANGRAFTVRVSGSRAYWTEVSNTTVIRSASILQSTTAPVEEACLATTALDLDFDLNNGAIDAIAYADSPQLRVQLRGVPHRHAASTP